MAVGLVTIQTKFICLFNASFQLRMFKLMEKLAGCDGRKMVVNSFTGSI
jgi:hypothetical protein